MGHIVKTNKRLLPHHRYQIEVVLLFASGFFLFLPFAFLVDEYALDMIKWQWIFFWPWMGFYTYYSLKTRNTIPPEERILPLKRPFMHWILFGLALILVHVHNVQFTKLYSLDLAFIIFSLFLADSYWDFRKN